MDEATLTRKIVNSLNAYSGYWVKIHGGPYQTGGLPDIVGCYAGKYYGLEVKLPGKEHTLTERQAHRLAQIRKAGGRARMISSVDEAMDFVFGEPP